MNEECDRCGAKFEPHAPGDNHGYGSLCRRCGDIVHDQMLVTEPDHVVQGTPPDDDDFDDEDATPLEDRADWPSYETGDPVGYDDARNLRAADIMREIRRMS